METKLTPSTRELRQFGLASAAMLLAIFILLLPWLLGNSRPVWPWSVAAALTVWSLSHPHSLIFIYRPWMRFGAIMGFVNTRVILGLVFFLLITPVGYCLRLTGRNLLQKFDPSAKTYRVTSAKPQKNHMEKPY